MFCYLIFLTTRVCCFIIKKRITVQLLVVPVRPGVFSRSRNPHLPQLGTLFPRCWLLPGMPVPGPAGLWSRGPGLPFQSPMFWDQPSRPCPVTWLEFCLVRSQVLVLVSSLGPDLESLPWNLQLPGSFPALVSLSSPGTDTWTCPQL